MLVENLNSFTNKIIALSFTLFLITGSVVAQSTFIPPGNQAYQTADRTEIQSSELSNQIFTNQKPYSRKSIADFISYSDTLRLKYSSKDRHNHRYVYIDNNDWTDKGSIPSKKPLLKYFYQYKSDFFLKEGEDFLIKINPVINFGVGAETGNKNVLYQNTRGFEIRGRLFNKLGFYSYLTENQTVVPTYINNAVFRKYGGDEAVPGEGAWTAIGKDDTLDYFSYRGYITFPVLKKIQVQFGHDKNFYGNGYRSLLLSDFGAPYLFGKVSTQFWRLQYQSIWTELVQQYNMLDGVKLRDKKYAAMHHLSINLTNWLNIGLFETVVYVRDNGFDFNYLNPVIFYKAIEWHQGSPDNSIIGMDWKANFLNHFSVYGQLMIDDFRASELFKERRGWFGNKYGFQAGTKYIDAFGISQLDLQMEYNMVRPYTYAHFDTTINYTHYNQPLAHPLGSNFREVLGIIQYKPRPKITIQNYFMYALKGEDTDSINYGGNIFESQLTYHSEFGNDLLQGNTIQIINNQFVVSYALWHNLFVDATYIYRQATSNLLPGSDKLTHYFGLNLRLNAAGRQYLF